MHIKISLNVLSKNILVKLKNKKCKQIKRPLPLDKKDSKYLDPRESEVNDEKNGKEPKLDKIKRNLK